MFEGDCYEGYFEQLIEEQENVEEMHCLELKLDAITEILAEISEDNIREIFQTISDSSLIETQIGVDIIVEAIIRAAEIRPWAHSLLFLLATQMCANPDFEHTITAKLAAFPKNCEYLSFLFLSVRPHEILKSSHEFLSDSAFFYFAPLIESRNKNAFEAKMLSLRARSDHPNVRTFLWLFDSLRNDFTSVHKCIVSQGVNPESRAMAIRYDRLDELQEIAARGNFDVNQRIDVCPFERCDFVNHRPTMLQYAAFYGAVMCFKWLLLHGADWTKRDDPQWNDAIDFQGRSLAEFAVAGGNTEIIRLVAQDCGGITADCIPIAEHFRWHSIARWLRDQI